MVYEIYEDKRAIRFKHRHRRDKDLLTRINKQYVELSKNPYRCAEEYFESKKCPKCKKKREGDYIMIYYIYESSKTVEIVDADHRKKIYKKWG